MKSREEIEVELKCAEIVLIEAEKANLDNLTKVLNSRINTLKWVLSD